MKITPFYIKSLLILALTALIGLQFLWLYNLYDIQRNLTTHLISKQFLQSIENELNNRREGLSGSTVITFEPTEKDTVSIKYATIETTDTSMIIPYNSANRYDAQKARQTTFKYINIPLNIQNLDSIFSQLLIEAGIPVKVTAIELYDKDKNDTLRTGTLSRNFRFQTYETPLIFVDINDSLGVKAYVQMPYRAIFQEMLFQLIISALLVLTIITCLFRFSNTIFWQRKISRIKKEFVVAMTHELKKPIASSMLILDFLKSHLNKEAAPTDEELLSTSIFELKKLNSYIERMQGISGSEHIELFKESVDLEFFFDKLKNKYENSKEKNISIHLQIENGLNLTTDIMHFANIMENLTENSIKYSGESIKIEIKAFQHNGQVQIIHLDNGWGISKSEMPHIFEPFYRGKTVEKRKKIGIGLGLNYVKAMTEVMGGSISVSSKEKECTEFTLWYPA